MSLIWKQGEDDFSIYIEDSDGNIIADVRPPRPPVPATIDDAMEHHRRRARLIAASPELLAKLAQVVAEVRQLDGTLPHPTWVEANELVMSLTQKDKQ